MPSFLKIAELAQMPAVNEVKEFPCGEKMVCVANINGTYLAMDNACLHRGGPLGEGSVEGGKVVCPWHGWHWDPRTGQAEEDRSAKLATYPLVVEGGDVKVEI